MHSVWLAHDYVCPHFGAAYLYQCTFMGSAYIYQHDGGWDWTGTRRGRTWSRRSRDRDQCTLSI